MHDATEDMGDLEIRCSLEEFEWGLVDFEKQSNLEDYFGELLDLRKVTYPCQSPKWDLRRVTTLLTRVCLTILLLTSLFLLKV